MCGTRRNACRLAVLAVACLADPALAQQGGPIPGLPARPVVIVVPNAAGGPSDLVARIIAPKLGEVLRQNVVVDNRPSNNGVVAGEIAARAASDGSVLMVGNTGTNAINATLYRRLSYDPMRDFVPIVGVISSGLVAAAHPKLAAENVRDLVAAARRAPGQIAVAIAGATGEIATNAFKLQARIDLNNINYKGGAPAVVAVMAGESQFVLTNYGGVAPQVEAGKLKDVKQVQDFLTGIPQEGYTLGDPNAPVTVTEFGDLRCPVCKTFALETENQMIGTFVKTGKVKFQYRVWPILGTDSVSAARCAIAAQQQNKLFEYQDLWYHNQQDENLDYATPEFCDGIAKALGLDMARFQKDREDEALWAPAIQDVQVIAAQENFGGTPSFIVEGPNGRKVLTGSLPNIQGITETIKAVQ